MMEQNKKVTQRFCLFLSRGVTIVMIKENTCTISAGFFMFIEASNPRKLNGYGCTQKQDFFAFWRKVSTILLPHVRRRHGCDTRSVFI